MSDEKGPLYLCAEGYSEAESVGINDKQARIAAVRTRLAYMRDKKAKRDAHVTTEPAPRYDEIYWAGVAAIDALDRENDE